MTSPILVDKFGTLLDCQARREVDSAFLAWGYSLEGYASELRFLFWEHPEYLQELGGHLFEYALRKVSLIKWDCQECKENPRNQVKKLSAIGHSSTSLTMKGGVHV